MHNLYFRFNLTHTTKNNMKKEFRFLRHHIVQFNMLNYIHDIFFGYTEAIKVNRIDV